MSLQDVSSNLRRSHSTGRIYRKALSNCEDLSLTGSVPSPMSVQSMLRTTTELGSAFTFQRPSIRTHTRGSRLQSTRHRSGSFDTSFASALHHQRSPRLRYDRKHSLPSSTFRRYGTTYSDRTVYSNSSGNRPGAVSKRTAQSLRLQSPKARPYHIHNHRSITSIRSSGTSEASYSNYGSYSVASSKRRIYPHGIQARSSRPTTGKRLLRYSPDEYVHHSATSSPAFVASRHNFHIRNHSVNRSMSSLQQYHSPTVRGRNHPGRFLSSVSGSLPEVDRNSSQNSRPPTPRYYDYSESFIEDSHSPDDQHLHTLVKSSNQALSSRSQSSAYSERAQPTSENTLGSVFNPAELPTHNGLQLSRALAPIRADQSRGLTEHGHSASKAVVVELSANHHSSVTHRPHSPLELDVTAQQSHAPRRRVSAKSGMFFLTGEKSQRDLAGLAARFHSPQSNKVSHVRRVSQHDIPKHRLRASHSTDVISLIDKILLPKPSNASLPLLDGNTHAVVPALAQSVPIQLASPQPEHPLLSADREPTFEIMDTEDKWSPKSSQMKTIEVSPLENAALPNAVGTKKAATSVRSPQGKSSLTDFQTLSKEEIVHTGTFTPRRAPVVSMAESHGKSTVDLLLEKHIESLGLVPESDTSSTYSEQTREVTVNLNGNSMDFATQLKAELVNHLYKPAVSQSASIQSDSYFSSHAQDSLRPRKLFASSDVRYSAFPSFNYSGIGPTSNNIDLQRRKSDGWLTLPSTIQSDTFHRYSRPTLKSGELADIDTEVLPLGCRLWSFSQLSLPTSFDEGPEIPNGSRFDSVTQQQNPNDLFARHVQRRRRRVGIQLKRQSKSSACNQSSMGQKSGGCSTPAVETYEMHCRSPPLPAELDGSKPIAPTKLEVDPRRRTSAMLPTRWSSITAAFPMPGTTMSKRNVTRNPSTRTHHSQRSQTSQTSLLEPLNSTRQRSDIPRLGSMIPRLPRPDLGPRLDTSTLNLSIPYAEVPSTIYPSRRETSSYFDDSPSRLKTLQRSVKRQLGMRPIRPGVLPSKAASFSISPSLPMRNGVPMAPIGSSIAMTTQKHTRRNPPFFLHHGLPLADSTYRKKGMVDKLKGWWRRQCIQKALVTRKKTEMQWTSGGVLV